MSGRIRNALALIAALMLLFTCSLAETAEPLVTVNGEALDMNSVLSIYQQYLDTFASAGYDTSDSDFQQMLFSYSLSAAIQDLLITQEMTSLGMYTFTAEENAQIEAQAEEAYELMIRQLMGTYGSTEMSEEDLRAECVTLADQYGMTKAYAVQYYQNDLASRRYAEHLMEGTVISDAEVEAAYQSRVAEGREKYAQDVSAFETDLYNGLEAWYRPEGYRSTLHILLKTDAETAEARLEAVQDRIDAIYARLEAGEDFIALIREYGEDDALKDETYLNTGYQVHRQSVIWDESYIAAAFSDDLQAPGDYSRTPLDSPNGIYILYYLRDSEAGPIQLTDEIMESLRQVLFDELANQKAAERAEQLYAQADIQYNAGE